MNRNALSIAILAALGPPALADDPAPDSLPGDPFAATRVVVEAPPDWFAAAPEGGSSPLPDNGSAGRSWPRGGALTPRSVPLGTPGCS